MLPLSQLNISEIFDGNADFSKLSTCNAKLNVNKIVQKGYFGIDELGTIGTKGGFSRGSEYFISDFEVQRLRLHIFKVPKEDRLVLCHLQSSLIIHLCFSFDIGHRIVLFLVVVFKTQ